jgi:hypothetical protein
VRQQPRTRHPLAAATGSGYRPLLSTRFQPGQGEARDQAGTTQAVHPRGEESQPRQERTKPLLAELIQANEELAGSTAPISGLVRIAASAAFGRLHVLPWCGSYSSKAAIASGVVLVTTCPASGKDCTCAVSPRA